ncbi:hypothetical protein IMG5_061330, partial [Ichthyophthirius multifiliis]
KQEVDGVYIVKEGTFKIMRNYEGQIKEKDKVTKIKDIEQRNCNKIQDLQIQKNRKQKYKQFKV